MTRQRKHLYVSIPYTGHEIDFPNRCKVAHERLDGDDVIVFTPKDIIKDSATPYNTCMGKCIEKMLECDEVVFADGWSESKGCSFEHDGCVRYNIPYKTDPKI